MSQSNENQTDSSKPALLYLRSTSAVSLNERFSQVLVEQLTRPRMVTFDPALLQQRQACVLLVKSETLADLQTRDSTVRLQQRLMKRRRRSVWSRLGWQQVTRRPSASRPKGFWSFRRKYRWRAAFSSAFRRRYNLRSRQRGVLTRRNIPKLTSGPSQPRRHLQGGDGPSLRGRGLSRDGVPTKKQLDVQLDEYMSMSKSRLDKELDEYMSMSRSRLDAELDEYMLMAGQTDLQWD